MIADLLAHAGVLVNLLMTLGCLGILVIGVWICRNPAGFWDQFNPYLRPYNRFTLHLGRVIGSFWSCGAIFGCIIAVGNAVRDGMHHHWLR